ncbi:MAG: efflux RND transporter periplasmic adaptor subunit [Breznakibacter sp.]
MEQALIGLKKAKADLINAQKALSNTSIKAPISGTINSETLTVGQFLGAGSSVCEIVNNNTLKINIKVSENEIYKLRNGQTVSLRLSAFPDKQFAGQITSMAVKADAAMKFNVEISLLNPQELSLRSGLFAEVELPIENQEKVIINKSSIVGSLKNPYVYVVANGKSMKREITTGQESNGRMEVLSGLTEGEAVVVSGQLNLQDGAEVNVVQ